MPISQGIVYFLKRIKSRSAQNEKFSPDRWRNVDQGSSPLDIFHHDDCFKILISDAIHASRRWVRKNRTFRALQFAFARWFSHLLQLLSKKSEKFNWVCFKDVNCLGWPPIIIPPAAVCVARVLQDSFLLSMQCIAILKTICSLPFGSIIAADRRVCSLAIAGFSGDWSPQRIDREGHFESPRNAHFLRDHAWALIFPRAGGKPNLKTRFSHECASISKSGWSEHLIATIWRSPSLLISDAWLVLMRHHLVSEKIRN
jgi:hypothetical protein